MLVLANKLEPTTPFAKIYLSPTNFVKVGPDWFDYLVRFDWFLKKSAYRWYAVRTERRGDRKFFIRMHRVIADTPDGMVCHHINGNTLDNRRENLLNMTWYDHTKMHSYR